jgi:hypothetical protein
MKGWSREKTESGSLKKPGKYLSTNRALMKHMILITSVEGSQIIIKVRRTLKGFFNQTIVPAK